MKFLRESTSVPGHSAARDAIVTFFVARVLLLVGVMAPNEHGDVHR
jgi:hypothetical protein